MTKFKFIFLSLVITIGTSLSAYCQTYETGTALDKVVAVVGNEVILLSDIRGQIAMMVQQNPSIKQDDPAVYKQILDAMINEKLMVTKAIEDSIVVTDEQVEARWQVFLQSLIQQFGSEDRIEQVYQKSITRMKFELRDEIRNKLLSSALVQQKVESVNIAPREIEEFFKEFKDSLRWVPAQYELYHIVKYVVPDTSEKSKAFALARSVRDSILKGGDFADFARRHSADPGSASSGGDLGWIEKGKFIPEFEKAAFGLQVGETSLPIETPFGFHIIQTLDSRKESIQTRHILFKVAQSNSDRLRVTTLLDTLRAKAIRGDSFTEIAKIHSDEDVTKGFGGYLGKVSVNEMAPNMREAIDKVKEGEITEPSVYNVDPNKPAYHIIYKKEFFPEHQATMDKDYQYIEQFAIQMKKMKSYQTFVEQLRKELYWEIKK